MLRVSLVRVPASEASFRHVLPRESPKLTSDAAIVLNRSLCEASDGVSSFVFCDARIHCALLPSWLQGVETYIQITGTNPEAENRGVVDGITI